MIRLRDGRGNATEVTPAHPFVEICTADGLVAMLLVQKDGVVTIVEGTDPAAHRYAGAYGVRWAPVIEVKT